MSPVLISSATSTASTHSLLNFQIIPPALLLISPLLSSVLLVLSLPLSRDRLWPIVLLALNTLLPAIAGGFGIGASLQHAPLFQRFSLVFEIWHECFLSLSSLYVLFLATTPASLVAQRALRFVSVFVTVFLVSETISGPIQSAPSLLSPTFSLISRGLQLPLVVAVFFDLRVAIHQSMIATSFTKTHEKQRGNRERRVRVSSPTPDTWPFPASLAQSQPTYKYSSNKSIKTVANLPPSLTLTNTRHQNSVMSSERPLTTSKSYKQMRLPAIMLAAQTAAVVCAAFKIALAIIISENSSTWVASHVSDSTSVSVTDVAGLLVAHSVFLLVWAVAVVASLFLLPSVQERLPISVKLTVGRGSTMPKSSTNTLGFFKPRTPKASFSRGISSDSASDFLSMRDPFASPPPPPTTGLGLFNSHRVQARDVAAQYRFPAPKAKKTKGGRKRRIGMRGRALEHQTSAQALLPRPPLAHTSEFEHGLGDEVLLARLLLQSLTADAEAEVEPSSPMSGATMIHPLTFPEPTMHIQRLGSRWSTSTEALSVSTNTAWSEKKSRASTGTSASAPSHRKSTEARKSTATGISTSSVLST